VLRALFLSALAGLACGYGLPGAHPETRLGRLAVALPDNPSADAGLDRLVADALRREALRRPGCELVEDRGRADWVLSGRVLGLESERSSLSAVVLALEYEITLAVDLRAVAADGREVRGPRRELRETERYLASADPEAQRKNRDEALRRVANGLAARFLDLLAERAAVRDEGPA